MLKIAYISTSEPIEIQKRKSKKEALMIEAVEGLAVRRATDRIKAKSMFQEERAKLEKLKAELSLLEKR